MKKKLALFAIGLLMLIVGFVLGAMFLGSINGGSGVRANSVEPPQLVLRGFRQLRGTQHFIAEISTSYDSRAIEYSSSSRWFQFGESGGQIRNFVFLDSNTLHSHKLFDTNQALILNMLSFPEQPVTSGDDEEPEIIPIQWFLYEVVHEDTNHDETLNREDLRTIGISDVDGHRYTEILTDVTEVYDITMIEDGYLLIVYRQKSDRFASKINLMEQSITTQKLPNLGGEVK